MSYRKSFFFNDITALVVGALLAALLLYIAYTSGLLLWVLQKLP